MGNDAGISAGHQGFVFAYAQSNRLAGHQPTPNQWIMAAKFRQRLEALYDMCIVSVEAVGVVERLAITDDLNIGPQIGRAHV